MVQSSKQELLAQFRGEYDKIRARVRENRQLVEQTQLEVNRLRERNVQINAQLSRVEANFDSIPRADIKAAYDSAIDARSRLITMQGQLDKAKALLEELQIFEQLLERMLGKAQGLLPDKAAVPSSAAGREMLTPDGGAIAKKAIISMVDAQESERQRLARQMHDGPAQSLTNFILQAEICQRLFDRNPDRAGDELDNLKAAAGSTFQKVRDFIFDLRPMMLDDLGLVPTMRRYVEEYREKTGINADLKVLGEERRLPGHIEVMMFRAIQTIMSNARDTLGAKRVEIALQVDPESVRATVEHDGHGFDVDAVLGKARAGEDAYGLRTLRDRVELVAGAIDVVSAEQISRYVLTLPTV